MYNFDIEMHKIIISKFTNRYEIFIKHFRRRYPTFLLPRTKFIICFYRSGKSILLRSGNSRRDNILRESSHFKKRRLFQF